MEPTLLDLAHDLEAVEAVRASAAEVLGDRWSPAMLRAMLDDPAPVWASDLWATVADLGWPDLVVPEARGGVGGSTTQLAGIAEEIGRAAAPLPFVAGAVAAWCAGPSAELRTVALTEPGHADEDRPRPAAEATSSGFVLDGATAFVPHGAVAESCVVAAVLGAGEVALLTVDTRRAGLEVTPLRALDSTPLADLAFHRTEVPAEALVARGREAERLLDGARARLAVGWSAELVGTAAAAHAAATEYARQRVAFDRPIGAFQAVKHRLVDLRADVEIARALVNRAAQALDRAAPDADAMVALCAFWAATRLRRVPEGAVQVFGGIGYTWEHDAHLFLRRAAVLTALLPPPTHTGEIAAAWLARAA